MGEDRWVFRRHAADGVLLVGAGAALLLQLADPRVAAGVARHSDFEGRPLDRLTGTLDYVYAVAFGDDDDVRHVVGEVNARHLPVRSRADDTSPAYSAFDADTQRFVASTIVAVALAVDARRGSLRRADADAIVRGYAPLARRLQGSRAGWPESADDFERWWAARVDELRVGDDARAVARTLFAGRALPRAIRLLLPVGRLLTAALLPPRIREAYGFRWTPRAERAANTWLDGLLHVSRLVPRGIRSLPMHAALRRVRRRRSRYAEYDL